MSFEPAFVALFAVATIVALVARRLRVPYTVALVAAGLLLGATHVFAPPLLTKDLLFAIFLPGLVFEAAFRLDFDHFWRNKVAIFSLAIPGLAAAIAATAALFVSTARALHLVALRPVHGLAFGALIAATDPIAVVSMFKSLGAPRRLAVLAEGESLLNDGTAIVFFGLALGLLQGHALGVGEGAVQFVRVAGTGALAGAAVGVAVSSVIRRVDEPMIEITLTMLAAYGSFFAGERLHGSGVIATVVAGMLCGNYAAATGMSATTRVAVESFWEYLAFALNSCVFLLLGFEARLPAMVHSLGLIVVAWLAATLGRALLIFGVTTALRRTHERIAWSWSVALTWGGLRGALSMVMVLALPRSLRERDLLVDVTFGVVVLSILAQGLTLRPLLDRLGIVGAPGARTAYEICRGTIRSAKAALRALATFEKEGAIQPNVLDELRARYEERVRSAQAEIDARHLAEEDVHDDERRAAERFLLHVERTTLSRAHRRGHLGRQAFERLHREVDERLQRLAADPHDEDRAASRVTTPVDADEDRAPPRGSHPSRA